MEQPKRTLHELKIALAILRINAIAGSSRYRVISSSALFLCWRNSPSDTLVEVLRARITGRYAQNTFEGLLKRVDDISIGRSAADVEAFLSARLPSAASISSAVRNTEYKRALEEAVNIPQELHPPQERGMTSRGVKDDSLYDYSASISYRREPAQQIYTTYPIYYGTDRLQEPGRTVKFGGFRGDGTIAYGVAEVSVPHIHREGKLERPWLWPTQTKGNPNKHIVIHSNELLALDAWFTSAKDYLSQQGIGQDPSKKEGLLFIHGYNVGFDAALWRAAQLCHDLKFPGLMLCFSWASLGTPGGYPTDEATVDWSAGNLRQYLTHVTEQLGLSALHIVAHSMGNRALLSVLESWKHEPGTTPIHQVILAAPDVDTSRFKQFGQAFETFEQVTLYASRHDRAIAASRFVHSYSRAGDARPPLVMNSLATVDVSAAGRDMFGLGHSYIATVSKVFRDLFYVVRHRHKPDQRAGIIKRDEGYWELT
ncbi:alpha/beta hydrolase [Pseudomonas promysalinigenes]|uniref:alpha/beta hydrolase n=1 Tax=Pseudomonas promysalinigenes TaxID=485898 RepID=UPI001646A1B7|nr:alpha/beta hydrolase [Pseudomonas promysalinigenes]QXI35288.1 alpha/beta hydrolase [Pseudomonas promysalinigenes]